MNLRLNRASRVKADRALRLESLEIRRLLDGGSLDLTRYESATELEETLVSKAITQYEGLFGNQGWPWDFGPVFIDDCPNCDFAFPEFDAGGGAAPPDHSDTNTQVAGVDEADIVENDGNYLYMLSGQELIIADAWEPDEMQVVSRLEIEGAPIGEFLNGDRLTIVSTVDNNYYYEEPFFGAAIDVDFGFFPYYESDPKTVLTVIDVADRKNPEIIQTTEVEGTYTSSRAIGDQVYLISTTEFQLPAPELACEVENEWENCFYETKESYLERINGQVLDLVLPNFTTRNQLGLEVASGLVSEATDIYKPTTSYAPNLITVSVIDTSAGIDDLAAVSVPTTYSTTVFGSTNSLYLTNPDWGSDWAQGEATSILKFDMVDEGKNVDLSAVGQVPGRLLNSFSMDEYQNDEGETYFHVATTTGWGRDSDNRVFVMQQNDDQLETVGRTNSLAKGEQIFSVRYSGTTAYVVTFVQTDPLFTIDLSNPASPEVLGELHITGFSNYMQPVSKDYLIGLGRDADPNTGRAEELQINLFNVGDLSNPQLADRYTFRVPDWAWSEALSEHHAVSYFPEQQVLTLPVSNGGGWVWTDRDGDGVGDTSVYRPHTELYVFQLTLPDDGNGKADIELLGTIEHEADIRRSVRIEEFLYSISDETVSIHKLQDPSTEVNRIHFGRQDVGVPVFSANPEDPLVDFAIGSPESAAPQVVGVSTRSTRWDYDLVNYLDFNENRLDSLSVLPLAGADQIKVQFTEDVFVGADDLRIQGESGNAFNVQGFTYDLETYTATWTLSEPFLSDKVSLQVVGVRDMAGERLDGDANGRAGAAFKFDFSVLPGDVDLDGRVDRADLVSSMARVGAVAGDAEYQISHDVDGNGRINYADFDLISHFSGTTLPNFVAPAIGDSNGDGLFDSADLVVVMQGGKYRTNEIATFEEGDWNRDGFFNESDFVIAFQAGTFESAPVAARVVDSLFANERFGDLDDDTSDDKNEATDGTWLS